MPSCVILVGYSSKNLDGLQSVWNVTGELSIGRKILAYWLGALGQQNIFSAMHGGGAPIL